jgi:short-subunit dehydrogenase
MALITGASAGIGRAFADQFAQHGFNLVLVARREDKLKEIAEDLSSKHGVKAEVLPVDLSTNDAVPDIMAELDQRELRVDVLVNNAGYAILDDFGDASWTDHATMLEVMLIGYTRLCHALIPQMKQRGYGRIINVSSLSAFIPPNAGSLYGGIKSYVVDLSVALDLELRPHGIHCTAVCPGFTYTEFHDVMRVRNFLSSLPRFVWMSADDVAREGYEAVMAGKLVIINGWINRLIALIYNLMPKPMRYGLQRNAKKWTAD